MRFQKKNLIGIIGSHKEQLVPNNSEFTIFFDLLRAQGCRSELIDEKLTLEKIEPFSAILIGVPLDKMEQDEILILQNWVEKGGNLFLIGTMGGDVPPCGYDETETNLGTLAWGIEFENSCLGLLKTNQINKTLSSYHFVEDLPSDALFITDIEIDATHLFNHKVTISYELGCTLLLEKQNAETLGQLETNQNIKITHSLKVPTHTIVLDGTRRLTDFDDKEIFGMEFFIPSDTQYIFLCIQKGKGTLCLIGSSKMFCNNSINHNDNIEFLNYLFSLWIPDLIENEISRRLRKPQRHRLLHGYPMSPIMEQIHQQNILSVKDIHSKLLLDSNKKFIVGVLPHPFCNPSVKGCGFCTFPHEVYANTKVEKIVTQVIKEIDFFFEQNQSFNIEVEALYFGGGTANLTPPNLLRKLCQSLNKHIDLSQAEVTLEGVPIYFIKHKPTILEVLKEEMSVRQLRISMGVQTFNNAQIKSMGRAAFGDKDKISEVVKTAHSLGYIVSCDLLFNLPGQSLQEMKKDIDTAIEIGFDQICLYHLVMFDGLGTEWSMDNQLLMQLPDNTKASSNWIKLREYLLSKGYLQNSLTNFEKADISLGSRRFVYEDSGYRPEKYNLLGFGTSAITLISDKNFNSAIKLLNPESSDEYSELIDQQQSWKTVFTYDMRDMKILYLTRKVVLLGLNRVDYKSIFNKDPFEDFPFEFTSLAQVGLIEINEKEIKLTPKGMFYADTIAGIFAWKQTHILRFKDIVKGTKTAPSRFVSIRSTYDDSTFNFMG